MKRDIVIQASGIRKSYGSNHVLKGIDLAVPRGTMLALLGPNGAGKTTTVRILSTLLPFDGGDATIEGFDVQTEADKVRGVIGLTGQSAAVDELLTGRENLTMMGRLYRLTPKSARIRADELLEQFDLTDAANRPAKTYSGGMRRRLDLAVSLIAAPPVIFLDEPTTGLDPRSRLAMWTIIRRLMSDGTTILLTTQYLEEADQLADNVVVIDGGTVIAEGSASSLKKKIGKDRVTLTFSAKEHLKKAKGLLEDLSMEVSIQPDGLIVATEQTALDVRRMLDLLAKQQVSPASIDIRKPTLDDVFLSLTGKQQEEAS